MSRRTWSVMCWYRTAIAEFDQPMMPITARPEAPFRYPERAAELAAEAEPSSSADRRQCVHTDVVLSPGGSAGCRVGVTGEGAAVVSPGQVDVRGGQLVPKLRLHSPQNLVGEGVSSGPDASKTVAGSSTGRR